MTGRSAGQGIKGATGGLFDKGGRFVLSGDARITSSGGANMRGKVTAGLIVSLLVASGGNTAAPPASPRSRLDALLTEYHRHGLPFPPKGAKLVRYRAEGSWLLNGKVQPERYGLALLTRGKDGKQRLEFGAGDWRPLDKEDKPPVEIQPSAEMARKYSHRYHETLFFALACHYLDWTELSVELLARVRARERRYGKRVGMRALRAKIWDYWVRQIPVADSDWKEITKRLKALMVADKAFHKEHHRALVQSLQAALKPRKSAPGSVEALLDTVTMQPATTRTFGPESPAKARAHLTGLGFKAVPVLIEHLKDERMTRHVMRGFNNFRDWQMRVQHVASDLLQEIAGQSLGRNWLRRQQGYPVKKANALAWWKGAKKLGEEAYALKHVLPEKGDPDSHQLRMIVEKYPKHLPGLYKKLLAERPNAQGWDLAVAVAKSKLPRKEKLALLRAAANGKNLMHRREALYQLFRLDRPSFVKVVMQTLKEMPKDVEGEYWSREEAHYGAFVNLANEPGLWNQLEQTARRSRIGLRMELLHSAGQKIENKQSPQRTPYLTLLAAFLDDKDSRSGKTDKRYAGPGAGFQYETLSVRDWAAMEMAYYLNIKVPLNPERTAKEWGQLRERVRKAWKREQEKAKAPPPRGPG
jgi:hypothetical protein